MSGQSAGLSGRLSTINSVKVNGVRYVAAINVEEARDLMAQMSRYMRFNPPGQGPFTDAQERDRLLREFEAWEAAAFPEVAQTAKVPLPDLDSLDD